MTNVLGRLSLFFREMHVGASGANDITRVSAVSDVSCEIKKKKLKKENDMEK